MEKHVVQEGLHLSSGARIAELETLVAELRAALTSLDDGQPWSLVDLRAGMPNEGICVVAATHRQIVGHCYYGKAVITLCRMDEPGYQEQVYESKWRYVSNSDPVPEHLVPTHFRPFPSTPNAVEEMLTARQAPGQAQ